MSKNKSRDALEAAIFKPTAEGRFVFRAPRPWVFGATRPRNR
jgi:hypothetical protein